MPYAEDVHAARRRFPRGLEQPPGVFRHGLDPLLLAAFVTPPREGACLADLGTGCGIIPCALGLRFPGLRGVGLERERLPLQAARRNFSLLGLETRMEARQLDLADRNALHNLGTGAFDLVCANPPYREDGHGQMSPQPLRRRACSAPADGLEIFCRAASLLLRHHGHFYCIFDAARLTALLACLTRCHLGLRRLRPVASRPGRNARRVLVEARKHACADLRLEPTLTIYADIHGEAFSSSLLDFCPWR